MSMILFNCHDATEKIEKRGVTNLGVLERLRLKMHLKMCATCESYELQSQKMELYVRRVLESESHNKLPDETKSEIIERLKNES